MEGELIQILAPLAVAVVTTLVSWGLTELSRYVRAKTNNENAAMAMESLTSIVRTAVSEAGQTFKRAAADGKLTTDEIAEIKNLTIARVHQLVPVEVKKNAEKLVADLDQYIVARIEREVKKGNG